MGTVTTIYAAEPSDILKSASKGASGVSAPVGESTRSLDDFCRLSKVSEYGLALLILTSRPIQKDLTIRLVASKLRRVLQRLGARKLENKLPTLPFRHLHQHLGGVDAILDFHNTLELVIKRIPFTLLIGTHHRVPASVARVSRVCSVDARS